MRGYVELAGPDGIVRLKPEWMIALGATETWAPHPIRRAYMHGGAQICVLDTPENVAKLLEQPFPPELVTPTMGTGR
jgi:hypothetical protein